VTKVTKSDPSSGKQHLQSFGSFDPFASLLVLKEDKGEKEAKVNSSFPDVLLVGGLTFVDGLMLPRFIDQSPRAVASIY